MGDNATQKWEWHNTVVGEGYAAKGVVRQKTVISNPVQIVDLSQPSHSKESVEILDQKVEEQERRRRKRERKGESKKHKKHDKKTRLDGHERSEGPESEFRFNPLLKLLARRLRGKKMEGD